MAKKSKKRESVLEAAKMLFAAKGFAGTSIRDIAEQAHVSLGVIYHHFSDKEKLWHEVKKHVVSTIQLDYNPLEHCNSLNDFLEHVICNRFELYKNYPEASRIVWWQILEKQTGKNDDLTGRHLFSPRTWLEPIKELQAKKEMRDDIDPNNIIDYMAQSSIAIFYSPLAERQTAEKRDEYLRFVLGCLKETLAYRTTEL